MAIITISRGSYSRGKEIAEKVADKLGYKCAAQEAILDASERFNVPESELIRTVHDAPSILDRFRPKEENIAYIQVALANQVRGDDVVYHGPAGHFMLRGISHVVKVRVITDQEDRIAMVMERHGVNQKEARRILKRDDSKQMKWSRSLCGIDSTDPIPYDLVLHVNKLSVDNAVDMICRTARMKSFATTPESRKALDNLCLACEVRCRLIGIKSDIKVRADSGNVLVTTEAHVSQEDALIREIKRIAETVAGVHEVRVQTFWASPYAIVA